MTHLLLGGGVPRVHGAQSPVPPRLPHFATPRSVHRLVAPAAGAYPPRRPPNVWSPGVPAPPGPCYWLVASGTPLGWRGGCPSRGAGAWCGAPLLPWRVQCPCPVCAALAAGSGGLGPVPGFVSSPFSPSRPAFPAPCVAGRPVRVSLILARWYAIPCGLCVPRAQSGCPSGIPRVSFACCALALSRRLRPPPPSLGRFGARTFAWSRCWAPVGPFHVVRAPPRVLPPSLAPFGLLGGGGGAVSFPPAWLGVVCAPCGSPQRALLRAGFARCGGGMRAPGRGPLLPVCGASGVGRSPTPDRSSFGAWGRGPLTTGCGCGG